MEQRDTDIEFVLKQLIPVITKLQQLNNITKEYDKTCGDVVMYFRDREEREEEEKEEEEEAEAEFVREYDDLETRITSILWLLESGNRDEFATFYGNPSKRQQQLSLLGPALDDVIQRAQQQLKNCRQIMRGITAVQHSFRQRYYAPGGRGAQRAQEHYQTLK